MYVTCYIANKVLIKMYVCFRKKDTKGGMRGFGHINVTGKCDLLSLVTSESSVCVDDTTRGERDCPRGGIGTRRGSNARVNDGAIINNSCSRSRCPGDTTRRRSLLTSPAPSQPVHLHFGPRLVCSYGVYSGIARRQNSQTRTTLLATSHVSGLTDKTL